MTTVNIFGICSLRDFFQNESDDNFKVLKFVQSVSPYSAVTYGDIVKNKTELLETIDQKETSNFNKRNLKLDIFKKAFDFLAEEKADYLLIDLACCRYDLYYFKNQNVFASKNDIYDEIFKSKLLDECILLDTDNLDTKILYELLDKYIAEILRLYKPQQIVLFEIKAEQFVFNQANNKVEIYNSPLAKKFNRRIAKAYDYVKSSLVGCHVVEFPSFMLLDENHKWGKYPLHYLSEYYDYGYQAMKIVAEGKPLELEKQSLAELKRSCETEMLKRYYPAVSNTLEDYFAKTALADRMTKYVSYFKELLLDETKKQAVLNYFLINKINCCAFYGASEVARFLVVFLKKFLPQIKIDFIVEDTREQNYQGVPFIKRNSTTFPQTDVIIIADLMYAEAVYKKLQTMKVEAKLTDVFKIANMKHAL